MLHVASKSKLDKHDIEKINLAKGLVARGQLFIHNSFGRDMRVEALDFLCWCKICTITAVFTLIKAT